MQLKELLDRERGNLIILIFSFLAWSVLHWFDIFSLGNRIGEEFAFIIYLIGFYILYLILSFFYEKYAIQNRIKIKNSKEFYTEKFNDLEDGKKFYGYLTVEIPANWIIANCYVTLERIIPIYQEDNVLLKREISEWYSDQIKPKYKKLRWRSPSSYENSTKINIGENSNKESFSVGKIVTGKFGDTEIKTFDFDVQQINPSSINFMRFGLYEFTIRFHWKRNGREMIPKKIDGYIYSRVKNGLKEIRVGLGDFCDNNKIPKPILKVNG